MDPGTKHLKLANLLHYLIAAHPQLRIDYDLMSRFSSTNTDPAGQMSAGEIRESLEPFIAASRETRGMFLNQKLQNAWQAQGGYWCVPSGHFMKIGMDWTRQFEVIMDNGYLDDDGVLFVPDAEPSIEKMRSLSISHAGTAPQTPIQPTWKVTKSHKPATSGGNTKELNSSEDPPTDKPQQKQPASSYARHTQTEKLYAEHKRLDIEQKAYEARMGRQYLGAINDLVDERESYADLTARKPERDVDVSEAADRVTKNGKFGMTEQERLRRMNEIQDGNFLTQEVQGFTPESSQSLD